jgi:hypothetical protein
MDKRQLLSTPCLMQITGEALSLSKVMVEQRQATGENTV